MTHYTTSAKENVYLFVETCVACGLKNVVVSPGSRNAPLVIAFDEHPEVNCIVIHDERSAAFFALGMVLAKNEPVAVLCTSGSAVLNYFPAVAEAFYQCKPLVVISADRPKEWVNHGDGQTIMQENVFGKHVRNQLTLSDQNESESYQKQLRDGVKNVFSSALGGWKGPIHINFGLNEPLYGTRLVDRLIHPLLIDFDFEIEKKELVVEMDLLGQIWQSSKKKLVLCGQMEKNGFLQQQLQILSEDPSVIVMVENTSNLHHANFIHCIDRTLESISDSLDDFDPEVLVTIGGAVISKKIKTWLRQSSVEEHWRIGPEFPEMDTYRKMTVSLTCSPNSFFLNLNGLTRQMDSTYGPKWKQKDHLAQEMATAFLSKASFCDLKVFELMLDCVPDDSVLSMANSSVIRYAQLFNPIRGVTYQANRGTSGIDGSTSTAAGIAFSNPERWNVFITGDVSFFYDSNALWNSNLTQNLRIVMINNGGGGIFDIIPGPSATNQGEKYFVAKHDTSAQYLCKCFGIEYLKSGSEEELLGQMENFFSYEEGERPKLMEIDTKELENSEILKQFFTSIKQ
ncbi:MAG: 2-succinyl-5-enolpyruvyl-6-hydroxy-3-cyclohexene-1-carboxylate synthase [Lentimonas sp.]|jgi:2-succinyl-5-enolpyruvyl-6-hydroxy-3-cyclohexene-1-carboxylate synthase